MIYFASDVHLGLDFGDKNAADRENMFVEWLKNIQNDCEELFLVGDIFDFWFEWNSVVPKGFVRVLGQIANMADKGVKINFFAGNHDKWVGKYFEEQLKAKVFYDAIMVQRQGLNILVAHGDGLGKSDLFGKFLNALFNSKSARWVFQRVIHPDLAMRFGKWWSTSNRNTRGNVSHIFRGDNEPIIVWTKEKIKTINPKPNLVVFGHLHTPVIHNLENCKVAVLGEWIEKPVFGVLNDGQFKLVSVDRYESI